MLQAIMPRVKAITALKDAERQVAEKNEAMVAGQQACGDEGISLESDQGIDRQRDLTIAYVEAEIALQRARIEMAVVETEAFAVELATWRKA